jgi:hypothetical protein
MSGFSTDLNALDGCRKTTLREAGQFGGIADGFTARRVAAPIFGAAPVADALAALADAVDIAATSQFAVAEKLLRAVERALDTVHHGVTETEKANIGAIRTIG